MVVYLNQLFFIKATNAAGQSRLSKFEAVECSKAVFTLVPVHVPVPFRSRSGPVPVPFRSRSGPVPLVRVAFTPAKIDRNRSGCGPVTRSHLFRTRSGTRSLHTMLSDVKIIKTKARKRACRNLRRNKSRQRAKK